jgi:hypothetical protein
MSKRCRETIDRVGASGVLGCRVGLYGRPLVSALRRRLHNKLAFPPPAPRATIKAHHPSTQLPSPLRNPGLELGFITTKGPCRHGWRTGALVLLFILVLLLSPLPASAHAITNTGRIYGQLLDGTRRNAPIVGQSVTLQMAQGDNARDLTNVSTDGHGMFSFPGLNTDKTISYALYTLYQGAQYYTDLIDLSTRPVQRINLTVYDATTSIANIAVVQANVLIDKTDAQSNMITISENYIFENLGLTTYVGSLQAHGSKPNALRFSLPKNAHNVSLRSGFDGYQVIQVDSGFATDAAVPPGMSQFAFSFQVPYTTSSYDFSYTVVYPTVNLSLLVPLNIHASSAAMDSQGPVNANQRTFQQFNAKKLLANTQIHVQLDGLPVIQHSTNLQSLNQNMLWIILAILFMLAIVSVTWFIYRISRRHATTSQKQRSQASHRGRVSVVEGRGLLGRPTTNQVEEREPLNSRALNDALPSEKDQQETLLQELLQLDKAYEAGTIKKSEYDERRTRTKAKLRSLMSKDLAEQSATVKKISRSSGKGTT